MKITKSQDGILRGMLQVEVRVSVHDLATYILTDWYYDIDLTIGTEETISKFNKRIKKVICQRARGMSCKELLEVAKKVISTDGVENPSYTICVTGLNDACDHLAEILKKRFKGFRYENEKA